MNLLLSTKISGDIDNRLRITCAFVLKSFHRFQTISMSIALTNITFGVLTLSLKWFSFLHLWVICSTRIFIEDENIFMSLHWSILCKTRRSTFILVPNQLISEPFNIRTDQLCREWLRSKQNNHTLWFKDTIILFPHFIII